MPLESDPPNLALRVNINSVAIRESLFYLNVKSYLFSWNISGSLSHKNLNSVFTVMSWVTNYSLILARNFCVNETIEFMFAGINMFWARLRLILARAFRRGLK